MKDVKAFLKVKREKLKYRPVCERLKDYGPVHLVRNEQNAQEQALRCMDCGIAFCHWACPLGNVIPEWNDAVLEGYWKEAFELLDVTNNLPEVTGRACPAPCEASCVLGINDDAVTICENELNIIEYAYTHGFVKPRRPDTRTGKTVAVIGSGPAGLAAAAQLNRAGHRVTVFERDAKPGGIMRYGIPDFKLEKWVLDRRLKIFAEEGVEFRCGIEAGKDIAAKELLEQFDVLLIATGSRVPRDLAIEGRQLSGIYFAMDYLCQSNRRISGEQSVAVPIDAKGKRVVVIGGGDTGSDCVGTANRQGASCVMQIEVMPKPCECRSNDYPWPVYPLLLKTSSSHEEGAQRQWSILTKKFIGVNGILTKLSCVQVEFVAQPSSPRCPIMKEVPHSAFEIEVDMVILAVGFLHPEYGALAKDLALELDGRSNLKTDSAFMTSRRGVFAAGDARRGQSLIVHAIAEGRRVAHAIDSFLMGESSLPVC